MTCNNTGLTGGKYCTQGNPEGVPTGIAFGKDSFSMTAEEFLLEDTLKNAVKAENFYPIMGSRKLFAGFENNNAESLIHEFGARSRSYMGQKILRFNVLCNPNEEQEKQLKKFHNSTHEVYLMYGNILRGRTPDSGEIIRGLRTTGIYVETGDFNLPDGTKGTMKIMVDIMTEKDKSEYGYSREVAWDLDTLDGLTEVDLEQVGTPTATEIVIDVYAESNGSQKPIEGLETADFAPGTGSTGTITSVTESATVRGRYTFVTVGLANDDTIDLVAPASISASDYFIKSSGELVVSGIA